MVGYVLGKTMSKSGSVSRGVCSVKDGLLDGIVENTKIYYGEGGKIFSDIDGATVPLTGNEWVSMNLFGFTPKALAAASRSSASVSGLPIFCAISNSFIPR